MNLDVKVKSDFVKTDGKIRYRVFREGGHEHYNLRVFVEGPPAELDRIDRVEYGLYSTFRNPHRVVTDRASSFALELWAWGMFDIQVTFVLKDGTTETTSYYLRFSLPDDTGEEYIDVG